MDQLEKRVRLEVREKIRESRLMERVLPDIHSLLDVDEEEIQEENIDPDQEHPFPLWEELFDEKEVRE